MAHPAHGHSHPAHGASHPAHGVHAHGHNYRGNKWKQNAIIILTSVASGKSLRIKEDGNVDGQGGDGVWAQFKVHRTGPDTVKLQSVGNPSHWLRIHEGHLEGNGSGGEWCEFRVIKHAKGTYSLRSVKNADWGVGILPEGVVKGASQTGTGDHGQFRVSKLYRGKKWSGQIILQSVASGKSLRINEDGHVDGQGGDGQWARFTVHRTGPNTVKLQNVGNPKHWLRIHNGQLEGTGEGGEWCEFRLVKHGKGTYSLRSVKNPGWGVGILPEGHRKPADQTGVGEHGQFRIRAAP